MITSSVGLQIYFWGKLVSAIRHLHMFAFIFFGGWNCGFHILDNVYEHLCLSFALSLCAQGFSPVAGRREIWHPTVACRGVLWNSQGSPQTGHFLVVFSPRINQA